MENTEFEIQFKRSLIEELREITAQMILFNANYALVHGIEYKQGLKQLKEDNDPRSDGA